MKDHKEALKNICQPNHESNDGPETMLEGESSYRSLLQDQDKRWQARENMLRAFGLDHENGSAPGSEDVKKFGIETTKKLGGGAFGEVFEGTLEGKKCIVKLTPPEQMSRERWLARPNEAMSMYLVSNKEEYKNYSENVHIVPPSHYIIAVVKDEQGNQISWSSQASCENSSRTASPLSCASGSS